MSSSVLEQIRFSHEQLELFEQDVIGDLNEKPNGVTYATYFTYSIYSIYSTDTTYSFCIFYIYITN